MLETPNISANTSSPTSKILTNMVKQRRRPAAVLVHRWSEVRWVTIAVAAIDDGSLAMRGAVEVLRSHSLFSFAGVFETVRDLKPGHHKEPVVLLVDPFADSNSEIESMSSVPKTYAMLVMSACLHPETVRQALQLGARGYLSKSVNVSTLLDAISAVGVGGIYLGELLDDLFSEQSATVPATPHAVLNTLTPRERDVLVMVARGLTHRQIGTKLNLSKATVDTYVHRVRQKVGHVNKAGLTRIAIDLGPLNG